MYMYMYFCTNNTCTVCCVTCVKFKVAQILGKVAPKIEKETIYHFNNFPDWYMYKYMYVYLSCVDIQCTCIRVCKLCADSKKIDFHEFLKLLKNWAVLEI